MERKGLSGGYRSGLEPDSQGTEPPSHRLDDDIGNIENDAVPPRERDCGEGAHGLEGGGLEIPDILEAVPLVGQHTDGSQQGKFVNWGKQPSDIEQSSPKSSRADGEILIGADADNSLKL